MDKFKPGQSAFFSPVSAHWTRCTVHLICLPGVGSSRFYLFWGEGGTLNFAYRHPFKPFKTLTDGINDRRIYFPQITLIFGTKYFIEFLFYGFPKTEGGSACLSLPLLASMSTRLVH